LAKPGPEVWEDNGTLQTVLYLLNIPLSPGYHTRLFLDAGFY
jgi:hypothetical protein